MTASLRKFDKRPYHVLIAISSLIGILPLLLAWTGEWLAASQDCSIGSGPPETCMILGLDWGYALNWMFVMGWMVFLTLPVAFVINLVLIVTMIIHHIGWRRRQKDVP